MTRQRVFQTRIARKTFLLFFISALLPLCVLTLLSQQQINQLISEIQNKELRLAAKFYALTINDHLITLNSEIEILQQLIKQSASTENINSEFLSDHFNSITLKTDNKYYNLLGEIDQPEMEYTLQKGKNTFLIDNRKNTLWLIAKTENQNSEKMLFAKIKSTFLWGKPDNRDQDKHFIVQSKNGKTLFNSSSHSPKKISEDRKVVSAEWNLHFHSKFGGNPLSITCYQNYDNHYFSSRNINYYFLLISFLTILLIAYISVHVIRRNTSAITQIKNGMERLESNDFDSKIDIKTNDELALIGNSFNNMAEKIGRQIRTMESLAEIDQMILERINKEEIINLLLEQSKNILNSLATIFLIRTDESTSAFACYYSVKQLNHTTQVELVDIPDSIIEQSNGLKTAYILGKLPKQAQKVLDGNLPLFATQIVIDGQVHSLLITKHNNIPDNEQRVIIDRFADHIAVALTNSDWTERLYQQAHYDALTGLPNRHLATDRLEQALKFAGEHNTSIAVFFLDLDEFKSTNDSLGHHAGDLLLQVISQRFSEAVAKNNTLARLGGDEFILIHHLQTIDLEEIIQECAELAKTLIELASRTVSIDTHKVITSASIGIAIYPQDGKDSKVLLKNADRAMYHAKEKGKDNFQFYNTKLNDAAEKNLKLIVEVHQAIQHNEFVLHYQPKMDISTHTLSGCEALIRWNHPEKGLVSPGYFIDAVEQHGIIVEIGKWVILESFQQIADWSKKGIHAGIVSLNVSPKQLNRDDFVPFVRKALETTAIDGNCVEFEITETAFISDFDTMQTTLNELRKLGIKLSIDDYGTGYASLTLMTKLPIQKIKIDRAFISPLPEDNRHLAIVRSIITLAHNIDLSVTAEGIETIDQLNTLTKLKCEEIQGFLISRPLPVKEFEQLTLTMTEHVNNILSQSTDDQSIS